MRMFRKVLKGIIALESVVIISSLINVDRQWQYWQEYAGFALAVIMIICVVVDMERTPQ